MPEPALRDETYPGDGLQLHAVECGPADGPVVVLLHGFPGFWYCWRHQIAPLAAAGFRVIALDQRGYNLSDKPPRVDDYRIDRLAADVLAVLDWVGADTAAVVGHDWGGAVAWWLGVRHPDRVSKLAVVNCPHPVAMRTALEGSWEQLARSWYIFAAQIPGLAEWVARTTDFKVLERSMRMSARRGTFTADDLALYRQAWAVPGAFPAMVNWYRAAPHHPPVGDPRVRVPTLLVWGRRDQFLSRRLPEASANFCADVRVAIFPAATHWVHLEEPDRVTRLLLRFLGRTGPPAAPRAATTVPF